MAAPIDGVEQVDGLATKEISFLAVTVKRHLINSFFLLSNVADVKSTNAPLLLGVDIFCEKKRVPPGGLVMAG